MKAQASVCELFRTCWRRQRPARFDPELKPEIVSRCSCLQSLSSTINRSNSLSRQVNSHCLGKLASKASSNLWMVRERQLMPISIASIAQPEGRGGTCRTCGLDWASEEPAPKRHNMHLVGLARSPSATAYTHFLYQPIIGGHLLIPGNMEARCDPSSLRACE